MKTLSCSTELLQRPMANKTRIVRTRNVAVPWATPTMKASARHLRSVRWFWPPAREKRNPSNESAEAILRLLTPYLDTWDENAARDAADSELVGLFDVGLTMTGSNLSGGRSSSERSDSLTLSAQLPIFGSETAADAMSTFIEISSGEKSRLNEVISSFMPSHRQSCIAYAERFCWARYMEITMDGTEFSMESLLERCVADGNRDIRSRLISMPCMPQFPRRIPSYLDNTATVAANAGAGTTMDRRESDID